MDAHKEKSKELRKTNFYIGKHCPEYQTAYGRAFDRPRTNSGSVDSSFNSTATHFTLGTSKETPQSEAQSRYKSSRNSDVGFSEGINRLETTKHHFDLGTDSWKFNTTAGDFMKKYENFQPHDFRTYLDQNRKINFTFGSENRDRVSIAKSSFTEKHPDDMNSERNSIRDDHKKKHYFIGKREVSYKTSHEEDFPDKFKIFKQRSYSPNKYTITLGEFKPSFQSVNQQLYTKKPMNDLTYTSKTIDSMLDTHFVIGADSPGHKTINQEVYSLKPNKDPSQILPETKMTSVKLGTSKNIWETSNKTVNSFYQVEKADYPYKGSFVVMGFDSRSNPTTNQENYKRHTGVNQNRLDDFTSDDIKKRHFSFGNSPTKYQSVNKRYGDSPGTRQKIDKNFLNELKTVHYSLGNDQVDMMTTAKSEFTHKSSPISIVKKDLRAHNIVLGTHTSNWLTTKNTDARKTIG